MHMFIITEIIATMFETGDLLKANENCTLKNKLRKKLGEISIIK